MKMLTVVPAYGRDYHSKEGVLKDYNLNKDFKIRDISSRWDGSYINKTDAIEGGLTLKIRYNNLREVVCI